MMDDRRLLRLAPVLAVATFLLAWQVLALFGPVPRALVPGPIDVVAAASRQQPGALLRDVGVSLARVLAGFSLAVVVGTTVGVLAGWRPGLGRMIRTPVEALRPIPPLAWIGVAIIWFGLGETPRIFVIFIAAVFPIFSGAYRGVRDLDPYLREAARTLGTTSSRMLPRVLLPGALPDIATGLRIGWGLAFTALVAAEIIGADEGLGYFIMDARGKGQIDLIIFGIIVIGLVGLLTDLVLQHLVRNRLAWHASD